MSLKYEIEQLEKRLAEAKAALIKGYTVVTGMDEQYHFSDDHEVIYDTEDNIVGVVMNQEIMKKYFLEEMK